MNELLMGAYEAVTVVLPAIAVFLILDRFYRRNGHFVRKSRVLPVLVFSAYICAVFYFTGAGTIFHLDMYGLDLRPGEMNLLPFSTEIDLVAYLQNILLFIPFGFMLPLIWPRTKSWRCTALSGLAFSALIEASQLINHRSTDVDDLIMNTAGALLGYVLFILFTRHIRQRTSGQYSCKFEPLIYISIMFAGHFLLFNEYGLAKILYNF